MIEQSMLMYYEYLSVILRYFEICGGKVLFVVLGKWKS